jgi:uncharacterized protein YutE (UPF0331/DUF86 family)/predicted nucleotidyltransferase
MKPDMCLYPRPLTRDEVYENLKQLSEIFRKHGVNVAFLFGSVLYDGSSNDLDIGVFFREKKKSSMELYSDLYFDLCSIFKADNIDIAILNDTGPAFRFEVISKGNPIYYIDPNDVISFFEATLFKYEDTFNFRRESHRELMESTGEGLMKERKINIQRVDTFLKNLKEALMDIQRLISQVESIEEFVSPDRKDVRNLSVHHLRIALESVLDISRHIIAVKGFGIADLETENIIDILGKNGVIPYQFSQKIRGMAGMRNAIVHVYPVRNNASLLCSGITFQNNSNGVECQAGISNGVYWNLDYGTIFETVKNRLADFEDFARYIMEYVEKDSSGHE